MGAARIYTLTTPYAAADLSLVKYAQSADVMTLTHPSYQDRDLSRTAHTSWHLNANTYGPSVSPPASVTATPNGAAPSVGAATYPYGYVVTAVLTTGEETQASAAGACTNYHLDDGDTGNLPITNTVTWAAVTGAERYAVYKLRNGIYGYVGSAVGTSFTDDNIRADTTDTPPVNKQPFASSNYPGVVAYFQQRRFYATSLSQPQTVWATQSGNFHNMDVSSPTKADDAITFTLVALQANEIRAIVPMNDLIILTSGAEFRVTGGSEDALTPISIAVKPQSYNGCNHVRPIISNGSVLYVQERGSRVRELAFSFGSDSWAGTDLTILADHLFVGRYITSWAYQQEPLKMIWAAMSDGAALSFTFVKEEEIYAWARHDTQGAFEDFAAVAEGDQDVVYTVVKRTIGGVESRFIERFRPRVFSDATDAWFLDCALAYDGEPIQAVGGLDHLEGGEVTIVADGNVLPAQTVVGGRVVLDRLYSRILVGLPYVGELDSLALDLGSPGLQAKRKRIGEITLRLQDTRGLVWGPLKGPLYAPKERSGEAWGEPIALFSGKKKLSAPGDWTVDGQIRIVQNFPMPATVLAIMPEVVVGD